MTVDIIVSSKASLMQENARLKELNREMVEVIKHIRGLRLQKYQEFHRDRDVLSVLDDVLAKAEKVGEGEVGE